MSEPSFTPDQLRRFFGTREVDESKQAPAPEEATDDNQSVREFARELFKNND